MIRAKRSQKTINSLEKNVFFVWFWQFSPPFLSQKSESLLLLFAQSLFFKDQRDRLALVALCKRAIMSESLPSLFEKEPLWANWSRQSLKKSNRAIRSFSWAKHSFALYITKTSNSLEKPINEFTTLTETYPTFLKAWSSVLLLAELGTRQFCHDNVTMFSGHKVVCNCQFTIFVVATPSRHWGLTIFRIFSGPWLVPEALLHCRVVTLSLSQS